MLEWGRESFAGAEAGVAAGARLAFWHSMVWELWGCGDVLGLFGLGKTRDVCKER